LSIPVLFPIVVRRYVRAEALDVTYLVLNIRKQNNNQSNNNNRNQRNFNNQNWKDNREKQISLPPGLSNDPSAMNTNPNYMMMNQLEQNTGDMNNMNPAMLQNQLNLIMGNNININQTVLPPTNVGTSNNMGSKNHTQESDKFEEYVKKEEPKEKKQQTSPEKLFDELKSALDLQNMSKK